MARLLIAFALLVQPAVAVADFAADLARAAEERTKRLVTYDPSYVRLTYPMGDPPDDRGVCSDVVIRAFRGVGIDLQVLVHEDMRRAFSAYPNIWGLTRTDRNIDHRRVPNLETFFRRHGAELPVSAQAEDYLPGDVVSWRLPNGLPHIGIVSTARAPSGRPIIVHNIGASTRAEDMLFDFDIVGHFRFRK